MWGACRLVLTRIALLCQCALVKHLPVLIFGRADGVSNTPGALLAAAGNFAADVDVPSDSSLISSVYLDNGGLDVYRARLLREEGATLVRLRWYGDTVGDETEVFVERKTHHESWTTDTSVKERFRIKAKHVGAFMAGELDLEGQLKKLKSQGASDADICRTRQLSAEVQAEVAQRSLRPGLRTMYFRTAFQLSSSNAVRVSLDTQLRMLDERTAGPQPWAAWHRPLDGKHPVAPHELVDFPYAVLEVKLQDAEPKWVTALLASGRLIPCTKYSKFLHGTASLRVHEVDRLPHWWDDASVVPPSALAAVTTGGTAPRRALSMASLGPAETGSVDDLAALPQLAGKKHPGGLRRSVSAPVDFVETATVVTIASSGTTPRDDPPPECAGGLVRRLSRMCVGGSSSDAASGKTKVPASAALMRHVPIRIEPKTFFANERTLLQWLHISILILFTALSLVTSDSMMGGAKGSGSWASDYNSRLAGAVMAPVSVIFIIYALVTYMWRAHRIARREPTARYDDRFGPCILVLLLLAVTITSIVLAIAHADWRREGSPVLVVNKYKSVTTTPAGPPLPGGAATNKSRSASLLRLDVNGRVACGQVHVAWPPFFRPRGVAMGPGDTLLVGSDYALAAVSLDAGGMASGAVQVWPATDISLTALAATPGGDVFLGSARPRNGLALYDVPARTVTHATSLDGDVLLGATQALSAMAIGPNRSLLLASGSGVEMLAVNVTRGNASAPLDWAAFRHLDGDALSVGLQGSAHIGGLAFHEPSGALLLMFDKAKPPTVRAWNMTTGQLVGDWPLPTTADSDDGAAASLASQPPASGAASQAVQPLAPGATWAGLALGRNGTNMFVVSASPPQLWRLALGPDMLPTCVL